VALMSLRGRPAVAPRFLTTWWRSNRRASVWRHECQKSYARIFSFLFARVAVFIMTQSLPDERDHSSGQDRRNQRRDELKGKIAMDDDDEMTAPMSPEAAKERDQRILKVVERCGSSPCFWWFYDRYERISTTDGKLRMTWRECCASLTAIGVTAMDGRPLTPETTRKTWRKVVERKRRNAARGYQSPYSKVERGTTH
jgi:hypothetical protein